MVSVNGNNITVCRGNTLKVHINIDYVPKAGDTVTFGAKANITDTNCTIQKTIPISTMILELTATETAALTEKKYFYDCKLTKADGEVITFINKAILNISEVVL